MIGIIDYGVGNLFSVKNAFDYLGIPAELVSQPEKLADYPGLVLPGVGAFDEGIRLLDEGGLAEPLIKRVESGVPLLGICLGMQLMFEEGTEGGESTSGLSFFSGVIDRFPEGILVPHVGWSRVALKKSHPVMQDIADGSYFYFVHSYRPIQTQKTDTLCQTVYGEPFSCGVARDHMIGVQFHPEKSSQIGLDLLANYRRFVAWN